MDQTLHRMATKEREEIKRTTKQKMARRHNKEGGNHLDQESNRQMIMEDTDGGLYPAVDGQSLDEKRKKKDMCFQANISAWRAFTNCSRVRMACWSVFTVWWQRLRMGVFRAIDT